MFKKRENLLIFLLFSEVLLFCRGQKKDNWWSEKILGWKKSILGFGKRFSMYTWAASKRGFGICRDGKNTHRNLQFSKATSSFLLKCAVEENVVVLHSCASRSSNIFSHCLARSATVAWKPSSRLDIRKSRWGYSEVDHSLSEIQLAAGPIADYVGRRALRDWSAGQGCVPADWPADLLGKTEQGRHLSFTPQIHCAA